MKVHDCICLHFSNYCYSLILSANQWTTLTKMSTQVAICHPVKILNNGPLRSLLLSAVSQLYFFYFQTSIQDIPFRHNQLGVQQQLDTLREETDTIRPLKRRVDEFRKSKKQTKDVPVLESEYALLEVSVEKVCKTILSSLKLTRY